MSVIPSGPALYAFAQMLSARRPASQLLLILGSKRAYHDLCKPT